MNYEQPRQVDPKADRPDAGKWRWTNYNRRIGTYPTGGCAGNGCPGHDTPEGAIEHHHEYRLSRVEFAVAEDALTDVLYRCEVEGCETHTASQMTVSGEYRIWPMCPAHHTAEAARQVIAVEKASVHS